MAAFDKPIPIAFGITELDPGGAERALVQIVTRLNRDEWRPHVFCLTGEGELVRTLRERDIPVICLRGRRWRPFQLVSRFANALHEIRPAILQTFLFHANIAGRWAAKKAKVPVVLSGIRVAERRSRFRLLIDRRTEHLVDRHICVSEGVAEFSAVRGRLNREKIIVIPNGVDIERFANATPADLGEFGITGDDKTFASIGRLDPQKGVMTLLDAFEQHAKKISQTHLLFIGDGPLRFQAERQVARAGLASRVHFAGYRNDVPEIMRAADCLVLASRWEGMPNVVLEAMAAVLPVVATRAEGVEELIEHEATGRLVAVDDAAALASMLDAAIEDSSASDKYATAAQRVVAESFTWDSIVKKYEDVYRDQFDAAERGRLQ